MSAFSQCPSISRNAAAGSHTSAAPNSGSTATSAMTAAHKSGAGRPSHQNMSPPSVPCTSATTSVP